MSSITVTRLYEKLSSRMGKETAEDLTSYICGEIKEGLEDKTKILATKQEISELALANKQDIGELRGELRQETSELRMEISGLRGELKQDIAGLRVEMKQDIAGLRGELKQDIAGLRVEMKQDKVDMIKWMFLFWVGQVAATFAIVIAFMKK